MVERKPTERPGPAAARDQDERLARCSGADARALLAILEEELAPRHLVPLQRNPHFPREGVERVARERVWLQFQEVRRVFVRRADAPRAVAVTQVAYLFWRDLTSVAADPAVQPVVRRAAERRLIAVLDDMALGEKLPLSRIAPREIVRELRKTDDPRVLAQLLLNPRLVEEDVVFMARGERTAQPVLLLLARTPRWTVRHEVRLALLRNQSLPLAAALPLITPLSATEARDLMRRKNLPMSLSQAVAAHFAKARTPKR